MEYTHSSISLEFTCSDKCPRSRNSQCPSPTPIGNYDFILTHRMLNIYYVPGTVQGLSDTKINEIKLSLLRESYPT